MNSQEFVQAIERYVRDAAVEDVIALLKSPPGRRVLPDVRARSDWYNGLSENDSAHVNAVIANAVHVATFGFLSVLDGARVVDDEKGRFELIYHGDEKVLLNPQAIDLHDLLGAPVS